MVGRDLSALFPHTPVTPGPVRLEVRDLCRRGVFGPVSFDLRGGEIVGMYGMIGSGRTDVGEAIFGLAQRILARSGSTANRSVFARLVGLLTPALA